MRITRARRQQPPDDGQFRTDFDPPVKRPWFRPKRFGYGYTPQTWQGYLLIGVVVIVVVILSAVAKEHHFPTALIAIPVILIVLAVTAFQRR